MKELLVITGIASAITILQSSERYHKMLKYFKMDMKPFHCELCLSYWAALATTAYMGYGFVEAVLISFTTAVTTALLFRNFNRL